MVNRTLIRGLDANVDDVVMPDEDIIEYLGGDAEIELNQILDGVVVRIEKEFVIVDVGYKSEGAIPVSEWEEGEETPKPGDHVKVLVEELEDAMTAEEVQSRGMIVLSKRKAAKIESWMRMMERVKEGDVVDGVVSKKIKGGLLVDIGVNVFLPASQVDIRRPTDINEFIGKPIKCVILKIDEARRNIVVSRRELIEQERKEKKTALLNELQVGQIREGTVKNIAEFGAFIDLGGIDGLLHITDMSWGRITDPKELVSIDQKIEVVVLNIDYEKEKISLGLKQKTPSPWEHVEEKYPEGSKVKGTVVNVMSYGAFVKLEEGVEGLVHISEMSWTKRINHPNEILTVGEEIEVVILGINKEKQEISLGLKQTMNNPWESVDTKYPVGAKVKGVVRNLTNYGAFVELEEGVDGLLHISDMSWVRKITHPSEVVKKNEEIECVVTQVDKKNRRIALGLKQLTEDPWATRIPEKYRPNQIVKGKVTKITSFGVFVSLEDDLEGLLHISELADHKVENPEEVVKVGEEIEVMVLRVDSADRKIGLSRKRAEKGDEEPVEEAPEPTPAVTIKQPKELKGGMGGDSGPLFQLPGQN
ncbi:MAG: 30S ribosomal protein S1 [Thermoguttaceae bacterium]|nr:30S ribosomal protein S1 [Thermoguttaceae bacterium]MBQ1863607.1 30S ribosomal protein S1 [Thermoguttaceae bacterium]MBQ3822306.1 30S ribosomal protein S1 [Thermoguttaceae bacterium]MBQ4081516.1 30S ribosomal protein S1 [Thermoguttaceae bacterium]MBQ4195980.1 30S ribosomal protein S1 [Thermoguttaceae bacterium]